MILISGNNIINLDIEDEAEFVNLTYNEYPICELSSTNSTIFPFINIPFAENPEWEKYKGFKLDSINIEQKWHECKIGYFDFIQKQLRYSPIRINNVVVKSIKFRKSYHLYNKYPSYKSHFLDRYSSVWSMYDYVHVIYDYKISLEIYNDNEDSKHINYILTSSDRVVDDGIRELYTIKSLTIYQLFKRVIPLLNDYVKSGNPINLINFDYILKTLPQTNNYIPDSYSSEMDEFLGKYVSYKYEYDICPFNISDALNIIYSMVIEDMDNNFIIRFGYGLKEYINSYIAKLINSILNINLKYDIRTKTIYSELPHNAEISKDYLSCLLYLNVIKNYDKNLAKQEYLVAVPTTGVPQSSNVYSIQKLTPNKDLVQIFTFLFNMDATHFQDGITRVGRDDREWKELYFDFPLLTNFRPSTKLIHTIDELLEIKLKFYQSEKDINLIGYSYFERYDNDYVPWLASTRTDLGSVELRKTSFHKLVRTIINYYLYEQNKFNELVDN